METLLKMSYSHCRVSNLNFITQQYQEFKQRLINFYIVLRVTQQE